MSLIWNSGLLNGDRTEPPRTCTPRTLTPRTHTKSRRTGLRTTGGTKSKTQALPTVTKVNTKLYCDSSVDGEMADPEANKTTDDMIKELLHEICKRGGQGSKYKY